MTADLCKCGHGRNWHTTLQWKCRSADCPCAAFTPAQPATEDECGHINRLDVGGWVRCMDCKETLVEPATEDECETDHVNGPFKYGICTQCGEVEPMCRDCDYDVHGHWPCDEESPEPRPASEVPDQRERMIQAVVNVEKDYLAGKYPTGSVVSAVVDTVILPLLTIDPAGIERVLGEHDDWLNNEDGSAAICDCGETVSTSNSWTTCEEAHRAHVASQVAAYLHRKGAEDE